jgi:hypothetical protein
MQKLARGIAYGLGFVVIVGISRPQPSQAQPLYHKVFREVYPSRKTAAAKCAICHTGNDKTIRTEYGKAVEEALGAKNVKDVEAIKAALKKAEGKLPPAP